MIFSKKFWIDCISATAFIFILMWGIYSFLQLPLFDAFNPISVALTDFEMTDIAFSQIRDPKDVKAHEDIVIVNLSAPYIIDRKAFAEQVRIINKYEPKVVGIDSFYPGPKPDTLGDLLLSSVLDEVKNLVMVTKLVYNDSTKTYDSIFKSWPAFRHNAYEGFANLDTDAGKQEDFKACRQFPPSMMVNGQREVAFGVKIAELFDAEKAKNFLDRHKEWEIINYRGNIYDPFGAGSDGGSDYGSKFSFLDWDDVLEENFVPEMIKDKIVIFGFTGENILDTSWDDKFFTPLNRQYAGKTNPDMYGVVIHANIVSMILKDDPIDSLSTLSDIIIGIILCFLNVVVFSIIYHRLPNWYDGLTKLIQLAEVIVLVFIIILIFANFSFSLNLTIGLAAIALAGDALEVYYGVVDNLQSRIKTKFKGLLRKTGQKNAEPSDSNSFD